jgi:cholesterol transport system auxiliary component
MTNTLRRRLLASAASWAGLSTVGGLGGCSPLLPKPPPAPAQFALDDLTPAQPSSPMSGDGGPTLIVGPPRAAAGFDTRRIVYLRQPHELDAFAYHQWVDTPAQMLAPLIAQAIERSGAFRAVLRAPTAATADLRLDTELIRLQHEFLVQPSRVRLTLRAVLVDTAMRRVLAWREFDTSAPSASEDPYGGVVAANQAVRELLAELAAFCAGAASEATKAR